MKRLLLIVPVVLLNISPLAAQSQPSQTENYGFKDLRLGMSIREFKLNHLATPSEPLMTVHNEQLKHPGTAACTDTPEEGIAECSYVDPSDPLQVSTTFVDGKLAKIDIEDYGAETDGLQFCFNPIAIPTTKPFEKHQYSAICPKFWPLWKTLTGKLGQSSIIASPKNEPASPDPLYAMRWQNDTSVAEFQDHQCLPISDKGGKLLVNTAKEVSEMLDGQYCGNGDDLTYRQVIMVYLDKALSRTLALRLQQTVN